ncbi:hypothetical protein AMJ50_01720 [Parcubacteria bacterium DG_74_3]|nr:MAG: hypothetical protein AMJ50_01720 [Parcubacteria bacterium DG_74_3]
MKEETKLSFKEFEAFQREQEKLIFKWIIFGFLFFIISSFVIEFIDQEILKIGIVSWYNFSILVIGAFVIFIYSFISWKKNLKVWLLKYILAIYIPFVTSLWIYFTSDPEYTRPLFLIFLATPAFLGIIFYDIKVSLLSVLTGVVFCGLLILYYHNIGFPFPFYDLILTFLFIIFFMLFFSIGIWRTRLFLTELLEKRREAEEAKSVLEVKVQARTKELRELTQNLDQKVKARTTELQERVSQLERFQKLTIGRELKMAELKKEIERLKKEQK